jgi:hypothetical protein
MFIYNDGGDSSGTENLNIDYFFNIVGDKKVLNFGKVNLKFFLPEIILIQIFIRAVIAGTEVDHGADKIFEFDFSFNNFFADQ